MSRYDGRAFTTYTAAQGLASNTIWSSFEDQEGHLWFGTEGGLSFLSNTQIRNLSNSANVSFQSFNTADGLPHNRVTAVFQLSDGKMAVGTNRGLTMFDSPQKPIVGFTALTGIEKYDSQSAYPAKSVYSGQNAICLDSNGLIWISTASDKTALIRFDYQKIRKNSSPPRIRIESIKINNEDICWYDLDGRNNNSKTQNQADTSHYTPAFLVEEAATLGRRLSEKERRDLQRKYAGVTFDSVTPFYYIPQNLVLPY